MLDISTLGIDIDNNKVKSINNGENYIKDVNDNLLKNLVKKKLLKATSDFSKVAELDCISICVPTPLNKEKNPDISYIVSVMDAIKGLSSFKYVNCLRKHNLSRKHKRIDFALHF